MRKNTSGLMAGADGPFLSPESILKHMQPIERPPQQQFHPHLSLMSSSDDDGNRILVNKVGCATGAGCRKEPDTAEDEEMLASLMSRSTMLHQEGRLEEVVTTLQYTLDIMEGSRRKSGQYVGAFAVSKALPENEVLPTSSHGVHGNGNTPFAGAKNMKGAGSTGVGQGESKRSAGGGDVEKREFQEPASATAAASAIAGVMNDLGCALHKVNTGLKSSISNCFC